MRDILQWLYRALGAGIAIWGMEVFSDLIDVSPFQVPFVTSIVLTLAAPDTDAAKPEALIGGHLLSCLAGFVALLFIDCGEPAGAVAVGLAALFMLAARKVGAVQAVHPPAGLDAFLIAVNGLPICWMFVPVLAGAGLLALFSAGWDWGWRRLEVSRFMRPPQPPAG